MPKERNSVQGFKIIELINYLEKVLNNKHFRDTDPVRKFLDI